MDGDGSMPYYSCSFIWMCFHYAPIPQPCNNYQDLNWRQTKKEGWTDRSSNDDGMICLQLSTGQLALALALTSQPTNECCTSQFPSHPWVVGALQNCLKIALMSLLGLRLSAFSFLVLSWNDPFGTLFFFSPFFLSVTSFPTYLFSPVCNILSLGYFYLIFSDLTNESVPSLLVTQLYAISLSQPCPSFHATPIPLFIHVLSLSLFWVSHNYFSFPLIYPRYPHKKNRKAPIAGYCFWRESGSVTEKREGEETTQRTNK